MKEILITSSVLILAILAIRQLFKNVLSRRFQYALWALVLVRLLIPGSLFDAPFSLLRAAQPVEQAVSQRIAAAPPIYVLPTNQWALTDIPQAGPEQDLHPGQVVDSPNAERAGYTVVNADGRTATRYARRLSLPQVLTLIWKAGMALTAVFFLISNLRFYGRLRKHRRAWTGDRELVGGRPIRQKIYLVEEGVIPSPCLVGNAIYITPTVADDPARLTHVLTHEATHARHLDPVWSLLRCVCLTVYWFDPLVWVAASCSRADCELACDESVLKALGEDERIPYGQTLLSLIPVKRGANPLIAATTMTAGKKQLKDRVSRIAGKSRQLMAATLAVALLAGILAACVFSGGKDERALTARELAFFNEEFFNEGGVDTSGGTGTYYNIDGVHFNYRNMFLTSLYEKPENVDFSQLLHLHIYPQVLDEVEQAEADEILGPEPPGAIISLKITTQELDAFLMANLGLAIQDTNRVGMDSYTYSPDHDAYYWRYEFHARNYPGNVTLTAGTRSENRVTLSYQLDPESQDWYAVTLEEQEDGSYWFVSNLAARAPDSDLIPTPEDTALYSLTGEELQWFNEEFFNASGESPYDYTYNIRNQFANPAILYDRAEDIDLYQLFYLESADITDYELKTVFGYDSWDDLPCPAYKLTADWMDERLQEYTGLTLDETNKEGLEQFTYSPEFDAYYWMHGDTNYCGPLSFTCGTREGNTYKLYHHGYFDGDRWCCVTLERQDSGDYHFRSNQICTQPAIPTPLPDWEPVATISLTENGAYVAPTVAVEHRSGEGFDLTWPNNRSNWNIDGHSVSAALMPDGLVRAAVRQEDGTLDVFLTVEDEAYGSMNTFSGLFGRNGFYVDYISDADLPTRDYYHFTDDGVLTLLLRVDSYTQGGCYQLDLDGDGTDELVNDRSDFFFLSDGLLYHADPYELLEAAFPELPYWDDSCWSIYGKYYDGRAHTKDTLWAIRTAYFDGENLLVYKPQEQPTVDHVISGTDQDVPTEVVEQVKDYARQVYEASQTPTVPEPEGEQYAWGDPVTWDDWRIESFSGPHRTLVGDVTVETWTFNYELHTQTPEKVVQAGGRYVTEDGWVSPGYPGCDYLFFQRKADGSLTYLWHDMINDMSLESWAYGQYLEKKLAELDFDIGNTTFAALDAARKLSYIMDLSDDQVILMLTPAQGDVVPYTVSPDEGNSRYYQQMFTDPEQYHWSYVESFPGEPTGTSLTITDPSWDYYIRLWEGSDLVLIKESNQGGLWYKAEFVGLSSNDAFYENGRIYPFMREWFMEAERAALTGDIAIPDQGQGPLDIVRDWAEQYEGTALRLTPGNPARCSFMKLAGVGTLEDMPESWFPAGILDYPHFAFTYDTIFVPADSNEMNRFMAGNTMPYEGPDPEAPQGAYTYSRRGAMYLKDGYWYCSGVGTG